MKKATVAVMLFVSAGATPVLAADPSADEIAKKVLDNGMFAATNGRATVDIEVSKGGSVVRTRKITSLIKKTDDVIRAFVQFEAPADVAGTKFLSVKPKSSDPEQYIYLPAFKKVKRIVGSQRSQSFMGTDFSYEDLEGRSVEESSWKRLPDDKVEGEDCYVLESSPRSPEKESYGKSVMWVHKVHFLPLKAELYDKAGKVVEKRMVVKKLAKKDERWIATDSVMETLSAGTSTRLKVVAADFKTAISDESLSREALER